MRKYKKILGIFPLILASLSFTLTSCDNKNNNNTSSEEPTEEVLEFLDWVKDYEIDIDAGPDKVKADLTKNTLLTSDDTIYIRLYKGDPDVKKIELPDTVRGFKIVGLREKAFAGLNNLETLTFGQYVTSIEGKALTSLPKLSSMTELSKDAHIEPGSIDGTKYLEDKYLVHQEDGVTISNSNSIYKVDKTKVEAAKSITIPEGITVIPQRSFNGMTGLESVTLPESLEVIERNSFSKTSLVDVTIPSKVREIGDSAFGQIETLKSFKTFDIDTNNVTTYNHIEFGSSVLDEVTTLTSLAYPGEVTLADLFGVRSNTDVVFGSTDMEVSVNAYTIVDNCFNGAPIKGVKLAKSVIKVGSRALDNLTLNTFEPSGFDNTYNLAYIASSGYKADNSADVSVFKSPWFESKLDTTTATGFNLLGSAVVSADYKTMDPTALYPIASDIKGYGDDIFNETLVDDKDEKIVIPSYEASKLALETKEVIGNRTFKGSTRITSVDLSAKGYYVGEEAFASNPNLLSVSLKDDIVYEQNFIYNNYQIQTLKGPIRHNLEKLIGNVKGANLNKAYDLETVELTDNITSLPYGAFAHAKKLKTFNYNRDEFTKFDNFCFSHCESLTEFEFPYSTTYIGNSSFIFCTNLTKISFQDIKVYGEGADQFNAENAVDVVSGIPNRLEIFGNAFAFCTKLPESVRLPFRLKTMDSNVFMGSSVKTIEVSIAQSDRYILVPGVAFNPSTDTSKAIEYRDGYANIGLAADENDPAYPNPPRAKVIAHGENIYFRDMTK